MLHAMSLALVALAVLAAAYFFMRSRRKIGDAEVARESTPALDSWIADALEVVPRTLAENAGLDATDVLSKLYAAHQADDKGHAGVDVEVRSLSLSLSLSFSPR